jgi:hypothetical protein
VGDGLLRGFPLAADPRRLGYRSGGVGPPIRVTVRYRESQKRRRLRFGCRVPVAANNGTPNPVSCSQTTGICVPKSMAPGPGPDPVKKIYKSYLCGSSPGQNIENWAMEGLTKGFVFGVITASETGPGAFVADVAEGTAGFTLGVVGGSGASAICYYAGAY